MNQTPNTIPGKIIHTAISPRGSEGFWQVALTDLGELWERQRGIYGTPSQGKWNKWQKSSLEIDTSTP